MPSTEATGLEARLDAMQEQLMRVQELLVGFSQQLEQQRVDTGKVTEGIQHWVTDYVSLRLQELVPHTCEHDAEPEASDGPYLPGTSVPCTEDVVHRVGRIPIPFVRQMVVQKVAEQARQEGTARVDVAYFEQAATF